MASGKGDTTELCVNPRHGRLTLARRDDLLFPVQVVFVALGVAAAALEGRRRLEDVPQRPGAGLTVGGEVVESGDELVALVADVGGTLAKWQGLHFLVTFTLSLIGIQDLEKEEGEDGFI